MQPDGCTFGSQRLHIPEEGTTWPTSGTGWASPHRASRSTRPWPRSRACPAGGPGILPGTRPSGGAGVLLRPGRAGRGHGGHRARRGQRVAWRCVQGPDEWVATVVTFDLSQYGDGRAARPWCCYHADWRRRPSSCTTAAPSGRYFLLRPEGRAGRRLGHALPGGEGHQRLGLTGGAGVDTGEWMTCSGPCADPAGGACSTA